ncbi:TPA: fimbria/pilus periplasmic chaperone [Escherichia coli]|nr:fimbria/pilus periplasmic chaperone [Escherichia coli]
MFNLTNTAKIVVPALALLATAVSFSSHASVTPDRTRLVFNESDKSISVTLRNNDPTLPYLAQSWIEDAKGNKISSPLAVLPPVQRIDAMMNGQVKVQGLPDINKLPADRESVFYFNVREIPPKSNKPNTLQIALQTRIKLFWRPKALENTSYVIISNASAKKGGNPPAGFTPLMMEPKTSAPLNAKMDSVPVLTYINDYGARMPLYFICTGNSCQVDEEQSRKG